MNSQNFNEIIENQIEMCTSMLVKKADEYADGGVDRLHNFRAAAALRGITMQDALAGMMLKHTVSVFDMCSDGKRYSLDLWNEKITDHINYLLLLKAVIMDGLPSTIGNPHEAFLPAVKDATLGS